MDAKKFFEEAHRMCDKQDGCKDCPIKNKDDVCKLNGIPILVDTAKAINETIETVEKWSQEHPRKTRLQDFLEKYPNAPLGTSEIPALMPWNVGYCGNTPCSACEKAKGKSVAWCWEQEVQDGETD